MTANMLKKLSREKSALLEDWTHSSGEERLKMLVRLMDIDDELSEEADKTGKRPLAPLFQKKRRFKHLWMD